MINKADNQAEWSLLIAELKDAKASLDDLLVQLNNKDILPENELKLQVFAVQTHLNRVWNSREHVGIMTNQDLELFSEIPEDFFPVI